MKMWPSFNIHAKGSNIDDICRKMLDQIRNISRSYRKGRENLNMWVSVESSMVSLL